jgi:hypothetical protein
MAVKNNVFCYLANNRKFCLSIYLEAIKFHLQVMQYDGNKNIYIFHFQLILLNYLPLVTVVCT